jgi:hypothetical protein
VFTLELYDVAYVPSFHISLVSFDRAWVRGIRWDTERMTQNQEERPAYLVELSKPPTSLSGYVAIFTTPLINAKENGIQAKQIHREQLPPPPRSWKELMKHPHKDGFTAAAVKEYNELHDKNTFKVDRRTFK